MQVQTRQQLRGSNRPARDGSLLRRRSVVSVSASSKKSRTETLRELLKGPTIIKVCRMQLHGYVCAYTCWGGGDSTNTLGGGTVASGVSMHT